jgi:hypothetical protein
MANKPQLINAFVSMVLAFALIAAGVIYFPAVDSQNKKAGESCLVTFFTIDQADLAALSGNDQPAALGKFARDKYAGFITEEAFAVLSENRVLTRYIVMLRQYQCVMSPDKIVLAKVEATEGNPANYFFQVTVRISPSKGGTAYTADVKGALDIVKSEGKYKITGLKITADAILAKILSENPSVR